MSKKTITTVMGAAIVTSLAGVANAGENPFALKDLNGGYQQVAEVVPYKEKAPEAKAPEAKAPEEAKDKKEMVCGEGKCGGKMTKTPGMNCGAMMKPAEKPAAEQEKAMEGKCAGMKMDAPAAPAQ